MSEKSIDNKSDMHLIPVTVIVKRIAKRTKSKNLKSGFQVSPRIFEVSQIGFIAAIN